jgi:hypothetical protein
MTCTITECTVNNSWWWTEELSETCRVSFQNKFEKLVHVVGFIIRKSATTTWGVVSFTPWLLYIQYWIGGWMGHRASLVALEKRSLSLLAIKPWFLRHPAHSLITVQTVL